MPDITLRVSALLFPGIVAVFVGLYIAGLLSGVEPELALARAGLAGVVLALLGRFVVGTLEAAAARPHESSPAGQRVDIRIDDEPAPSPHPAEAPADQRGRVKEE